MFSSMMLLGIMGGLVWCARARARSRAPFRGRSEGRADAEAASHRPVPHPPAPPRALRYTALERWGLVLDAPTFYGSLYNFAVVGVIAVFYQKGVPTCVCPGVGRAWGCHAGATRGRASGGGGEGSLVSSAQSRE